MFFQQRPAANATLSYFFGCAGHAKALAVDVVAGDEEWFIDQALAVKAQRLARGETAFVADPSQWGQWIADIERSAGSDKSVH